MAYLGDRVPQVYQNSMRVTEPSRFYVLGAECFAQIMNEWFPMAVHLLEGLFFGGQRTREAVGQRERLLALGSLTAGLTHELNNPAAAAVRATSSLRERVAGMRGKLAPARGGQVRAGQLEALIELQQRAAEQVAKAPKLDPMETSDARRRGHRLAGGPRLQGCLAARPGLRAGAAWTPRGSSRCSTRSART